MSYEGYEQAICENGHYQEVDAYFSCENCRTCGAPIKWTNSVEETNGGPGG